MPDTNPTDDTYTDPDADNVIDATEETVANDETTEDQKPAAATEATDDHGETANTEDHPGREAARYRRRLRDTEAQLDKLAGKLTALQTAQAEQMAAEARVKPDALWAATELDTLLSDEGTIDAKKLDTAIQSARERFGLPDPRHGNIVPNEGRTPTTARTNSWEAAFSRR